jgi:hypothetical protein
LCPGKQIGSYQSASVYEKDRVPISWERLIFSNASSIELAGVAGADQRGYARFGAAGPYKGVTRNRAMKLKLKEKELPPVQLRLALPAAAMQMLDR